ncbi:NirD/YgiW/YdeI family stress tolerance protein [Tatumella sp. TA1]|uniref:YgiW/YdeI family stress tolerance OB fold protein n=1 Tax=Rosenbergiella collisarenosi TaxID=1544695 RepID=UPI0008F957BB|nr:NirD/YgiW/YdeI family stress tolerance protein [Rosenbergiella collisarenosi]QGX92103.1 NirD/YgiW/YdeI family stress tolerance protein [Tatumella sp. TA1]
MKKLLLLSLLSSLTLPAFADQGGFTGPGSDSTQRGGFNGPHKTLSVAQAKALKDDTKVVVEGNITKKISDEHYEFMDSSGSIVVEIDDHKWNGQSISPKNRVRLEGEIDKDGNNVDIDIKTVTLVN